MLPLLALLFVLSGAAGLIYETVWTRYLSLFVGHSAYAQILVLVIFLGGMAIGSLIVGSRSQRLRNPLYWYAAVELLVGCLGAIFHPAFVAITNAAYNGLFPALGSGPALTVAKWTIAALLILPQSILLGATFPLMTAGALRLPGARPGKTLGLLYFANSFGAAAGVLVEGFVLIGAVGLPGTLICAAVLNAAVAALVVIVLSVPFPFVRTVGGALKEALGGDAVTESSTEPLDAAPRLVGAAALERVPGTVLWRALLAVSFGTALSSFIYEIGWVRMLSLVLGSATHSFELMLSAFILGLALGAFWIRTRIDRDETPLRTLGLVQWAMGVLAIATVPIYLASFRWMATLMEAFNGSGPGYTGFSLAKYAITLAVMLPATFCAGMTFPLITRALYVAGHGERSVGAVYGVNTLGSIVGAALAGLVLMPALGLKWLLITGAAIDIAIGVALVLWDRRVRPPAPAAPRGWSIAPAFSLMGPVVLTGAIVSAIAIFSTFDRDRLTSGVYRYARVPAAGDYDFLYYRDGRTATVSVARAADDTNSLIAIATNGKPDASISPVWMRPHHADDPPVELTDDMGTQLLLPLITLAHAPLARTAAVIGEGSGMTSHLLLGSPNLQRLYTIEIEPDMIRASRAFYPANRRVFDDPRSIFVLDDARAFLSASGTRFDLILSEPSNPWVSGVAGLFTREFYRRVRTQLAPNGVFGQWLHLYEINDGLVSGVLAAIDGVFSSYEVFLVSDSDILVVASMAPTLPHPDWSVVQFPALATDLERAAPIAPEQFDAMRIAGRALLHPYLVTRVAPNSDFFPTLDLGTERTRFQKDFAMGYLALGEARLDLSAALSGRPRGFGGAFENPTPEIARARGLVLGTRMRSIHATPMADAVAQADSELRDAVYRYDEFERGLLSDTPPADWRLWTLEMAKVEGDLDAGTAGVADEPFFAEVGRYLDRRSGPPEARAAVAFVHGLAAWNYPEAATASDLMIAARVRGETWLPLELLRDGSALARLEVGRTDDAWITFQKLARFSDDPPTLSDHLLQALCLSAKESGRIPGSSPTTPLARPHR